ncbi:MAG: magnesium-protoporphyrin IX monomethyl ester (oxidative) cyclase [Polyangiaceae bacterium]|jgi:magnesium-protoporphyrin IX monomethyl ester (oxidative) cyclase|nr:magnesium-protoporphyrin IX monomethyl ester (oxidative) cyclase [Polyangiaceae bacterium]
MTTAFDVTPARPAGFEPLFSTIESVEDATQKAEANTLLSPRFYRTDYEAMNRIDVTPVRAEWDAMMKEYEGDNNHDHFKRSADFTAQIRTLEPALQQEFLDFLVTSVTSEYSGCVLYNEIREHVDNPDIKQLMTYLTRDEARHANFINRSLQDFGLGVNLAALKKKKAYTYFKPKYIFYAVYLSEKIGYARYISIFRQLEAHPERRFHPIFRWFDRWCNDEFRHGESFALILRANPHLLRGLNTWWIRFFLNAVYTTMYVRDHTRPLLHEAMGLDSTEYDFRVFDITSEISKQCFPLTLDTNSPRYRAGLERMRRIGDRAMRAKKRGGLTSLLERPVHAVAGAATFLQLMLVPVIPNELPAQVRVTPRW